MLEPVAGNLSAMIGFEYGYFGRLDYTFNRRNRLPSDVDKRYLEQYGVGNYAARWP